jgi:type III secretion protein C
MKHKFSKVKLCYYIAIATLFPQCIHTGDTFASLYPIRSEFSSPIQIRDNPQVAHYRSADFNFKDAYSPAESHIEWDQEPSHQQPSKAISSAPVLFSLPSSSTEDHPLTADNDFHEGLWNFSASQPEQMEKNRFAADDPAPLSPPAVSKISDPDEHSDLNYSHFPELFEPLAFPEDATIPTSEHPLTIIRPDRQIAQAQPGAQQGSTTGATAPAEPTPAANEPIKSILINFNNVAIIEYIRFISRITNKNFIFDENDLQFNVTIVSEEPTSIENIMAALIQELRIHDLTLIEQGNNLIIHKNPRVNSLSKVVSDDLTDQLPSDAEIITQVFRLNTLEPEKAATIIRPLVSSVALVETMTDPNHIIVTDIVTNVQQIGKLLKSLDAPNSGLVIGQYVARTTDIETLLPLVQRIMTPISQDHPLIFVPYEQAQSIFIVSSPFLVERSISILQHLDQEKGKTRIIDLKELKFEQAGGTGAFGPGGAYPGGGPGGLGRPPRPGEPGYRPGFGPGGAGYPEGGVPTYPPGEGPGEQGGWQYGPGRHEYNVQEGIGEGLNIYPMFIPVEVPAVETPEQRAERERCQRLPKPTHVGVVDFAPPVVISRQVPTNDEFIAKPTNRVKFFIYKLQYRRGDLIIDQVHRVGETLRNTKGNDELLSAIDTAQWLEDAKAIVFSGTPENLEKVKELIEQIDIPLRQVYIEMLILQTTVNDSLNFSCNFASRFGGGHQAGSQGFLSGASPLQGTMDTTQVTGLGGAVPNPPTPVPFNNALVPDPTNLAKQTGFSLGILGQKIIHKGLGIEFDSIGALVKAEHDRNVSTIVLSPKIITEDNVPAYIFVGINTPFQTQSVANNNGNIVTSNFEYRDVGTSLQVTPHLFNSDLITLEIIEERSSIANPVTPSQNSNLQIAPTTAKATTKTTINIPDGYFVIISGMLETDTVDNVVQVPCLGVIPLLGGGFKDRGDQLNKSNLMIFLRPQIIDTDEQLQNITRHGQDEWYYKNELPKMWVEETEGALDFFNVRRTENTDDQDDPEVHQFGH